MQLHNSNSSQFHSPSHSHSRAQSQSQSHHSFPGSTHAPTVGHARSYSIQSSLGVGFDGQQLGHVQDSLANNNDDMKAVGSAGTGNGAAAGIATGLSAAAGVGLGIALSPTNVPSVEVSSFMNLYMLIYFCVLRRDVRRNCYYPPVMEP